MVKVLTKGNIQVTCKNCGSELSLEYEEAVRKNTSPPMWYVECPVCYEEVNLTCASGSEALYSRFFHHPPVKEDR